MEEQTSFVDALRAKYCDDDAENGGCESFVQITVFGGNSRRRPRGDSAGEDGGRVSGGDGGDESVPELDYLKSVVLYNSRISHAAIPSVGLSSLCPNVHDLDLSSNLLGSWNEVMTILKHLPRLKFVNLSSNPLGNCEIARNEDIPCPIEDLVLNDTKVTWSEVAALSRLMPKLKQLHLCKNDYNAIDLSDEVVADTLRHLRLLALNNNHIKRWDEVAKLKSLPQLHTLVLLENPLEDVYYKQTHPEAPPESSDKQAQAHGSEDAQACFHGNKVNEEKNQSAEEPDDAACCEQQAASKDKENVVDSNLQHVVDDKQDSQPSRNDDCQPLLGMNGEGRVDEDAVEGSPGYVSLERAGGNTKEESGDLESARSRPSEDSEECNKTGTTEPTDIQSSGSKEQEDPAFPALESLCVTGTSLSDWKHLQELRHFPSLHSIKIKKIPLLESWDEADRRKVAVACLPSIKLLNGSEITPEEREKSERHFVRVFVDHEQPPARLEELVQKYGKLKPLYQVDISRGYKEFMELRFIYGGRCIHQGQIRMVESVKQLKKFCSDLIDTSPRMVKLYHMTQDPDTNEPVMDELFLDSLPMSRFDLKDGDEILIDLKKGQNFKGPEPLWEPGIKLAP